MRALLLGKNPIAWLVKTVRTKGLRRVLQILWQASLDATWDWMHGTETLRRIRPAQLETDSENKSLATDYGATRARPLVRLLRRLKLPLDAGFVDLGCGKGRVLLIAAEHGFRRVVGVDFSEPLCAIARSNIENYRRRRDLCSEILVIHSDVTQYSPRSDDSVFFLYDPFHASILARVLEGLRESVAKNPRRVWFIYNSPRCHEVMMESGLFSSGARYEIGGNEFTVYES